MKKIFILILTSLIASCSVESETNAQGEWIKGSPSEKMEAMERHFRGFDMAMVETGYRYQELYWAGTDENWGYAEYQLKKIGIALKRGLERRPKRAASAKEFQSVTIPEMKAALQTKDINEFNKAFDKMTVSCMNCHVLEKVPYFIVQKPLTRQSPIRKQ